MGNTIANVFHIGVNEVTQYTNYEFDHIVRFNNKYYGIKSDGIYLLEGDDDAGTTITESVKFNDIDFNTTLRKRVPYIYIDSVNDTNITTFVDREEISTYRSRLGNKRTKLAKGPKGRYWAVEVQNVQGNKLDFRNVEFFPHILDRKV